MTEAWCHRAKPGQFLCEVSRVAAHVVPVAVAEHHHGRGLVAGRGHPGARVEQLAWVLGPALHVQSLRMHLRAKIGFFPEFWEFLFTLSATIQKCSLVHTFHNFSCGKSSISYCSNSNEPWSDQMHIIQSGAPGTHE